MRHIRTFESYEDPDGLRDFTRNWGIQKRRIESSDIKWADESGQSLGVKYDLDKELNFLEDWKGPGGIRVESIKGTGGLSSGIIYLNMAEIDGWKIMILIDYRFPRSNDQFQPLMSISAVVRDPYDKPIEIKNYNPILTFQGVERRTAGKIGFFENILNLPGLKRTLDSFTKIIENKK